MCRSCTLGRNCPASAKLFPRWLVSSDVCRSCMLHINCPTGMKFSGCASECEHLKIRWSCEQLKIHLSCELIIFRWLCWWTILRCSCQWNIESWQNRRIDSNRTVDSTIKIDLTIRIESTPRIDSTLRIDSTFRIDSTDILIWSSHLNILIQSSPRIIFELKNIHSFKLRIFNSPLACKFESTQNLYITQKLSR